ncbi:MAG: hypothetical protein M3357_14220 [Actinomycetota bacterium]|nr:hypothetical protein [Actinomycetota bacterium]
MSEARVPQNEATSIESLLDLAAGVDFLIRSAHQRQAAIAADQLARGLLYHYRVLQNARPVLPADEADALARKMIIAIVEAKVASANARAGRAPHISRLRSLVEDLRAVEAVEDEAAGAVLGL